MEKRDLILRMIEQTAQLLRAVFNSLPLDNLETACTFLETTSTLKDALHLELKQFIQLTDAEALALLQSIEGMNLDNIELLADILILYAKTDDVILNHYVVICNQKALFLYQHVAKTSATYDYSRQIKMQQILQSET